MSPNKVPRQAIRVAIPFTPHTRLTAEEPEPFLKETLDLKSPKRKTAPRDAKPTLQEGAKARRLPLPDYREVGREGPAHAPAFVVEVTVKGQEPLQGRGPSKREAERQAAAALLTKMGEL